MDHEHDKHPHAKPLMGGPPDQLKRHQEQEQHGHDHVNYDFYRLLFKDYKAADRKVLGEDFNYDKYKYYKSIIDICKSFYKEGIDGWILTVICLRLDKDFGKENVRDELLKNYHIRQAISDGDDGFKDYTLDFYNKVNSLRYSCKDRVYDRDDKKEVGFNSIILFLILNKLVNKEILENNEDYKIAFHIAEDYREKYVRR